MYKYGRRMINRCDQVWNISFLWQFSDKNILSRHLKSNRKRQEGVFWKHCFIHCFLSFDFQFNKKTRRRFVQPQTSKMWNSSTWTNQSTMVLEIRNPTYMFVLCKIHKAFLILAETESSFLPWKKKKESQHDFQLAVVLIIQNNFPQWMSCPGIVDAKMCIYYYAL